jgi:hypothetical protein
MKSKNKTRLRSMNPEWWLVLSLFVVSAIVTIIPLGGRMLLFLYLAPIMIAAFLYGRRHAILTSIACVLLVMVGTFCKDVTAHSSAMLSLSSEHWGSLALWALMTIGFGCGLGWLFGDVRQTNEGVLNIMRYMVGRDNERHNYVRRLSFFAGVIAHEAKLTEEQCETVRRAALLRDIGELDLSRDTFKRFTVVCDDHDMRVAPENGAEHHVSLGEVMDLVLADKMYGSKFDRQPMGARILAVATEFDDLTSSKRRRSALPASVAKTMIEREAGKKFDPTVVRAFARAFDRGTLTHDRQSVAVASGE